MKYQELYEKIVDTLVADGYIVIENALSPKLCKELQAFASAQTNFKKAAQSQYLSHLFK